ncbi:cellulose biosynthesis protein BcsQ [Caldimonas tepidiphila]|uniref:cellulose biosynthesis protein BcsQ n=1 Tax=Caldimonas tepidiphila TaxID=2315841 RepID=UPI000E5A6528|nr:cellulose biosynthesis protein BcsQ [Caldimonas tepidiphila]
MKVIVVASAKGGVGKTSVTANLAPLLASRGACVTAIDLDPQNALRLHFGIAPTQVGGMARATLAGSPWQWCSFEAAGGMQVLPFGEIRDEDLRRFEHHLDQQPHWLAEHLARLEPGEQDVFVIDTPPGPTPYLRQALAVADHVLVVLQPDAASYATVPLMTRLAEAHCGARAGFGGIRFVVNQLDSSRPFSRDVFRTMQSEYGERLLTVIHQDPAVGEALACAQRVDEYAPHSLATQDFRTLAERTLRLLFDEPSSPAAGHAGGDAPSRMARAATAHADAR